MRIRRASVGGNVTYSAALAFGELASIVDIGPLLDAFEEGDARVRSALTVSFGNLRDRRAFDAMINTLDDPDIATQIYAVIALGKIGDIRAVEHLKEKISTENEALRREMLNALELIGERPDSPDK